MVIFGSSNIIKSIEFRHRLRKKQEIINRHKKMSTSEIVDDLQRRYLEMTGRHLNLDEPETFTEKIQWTKLFDLDEEKTTLSDKYAVRSWVEGRIGEEYLIPLYGCWDHANEIDFDALPSSFVLKTNNACGTNIIVRDKGEIDAQLARSQLDAWLEMDFGWETFEAQYMSIPPKIIAEKLLIGERGSDPTDYKFLCFNGKPEYIWVTDDRSTNHTELTLNTDWTKADWRDASTKEPETLPEKPKELELMLEIARKLSTGFSHVRVDLYCVSGRVYFGEMTFTSGSGFFRVEPSVYDERIGALWRIDDAKTGMFDNRLTIGNAR